MMVVAAASIFSACTTADTPAPETNAVATQSETNAVVVADDNPETALEQTAAPTGSLATPSDAFRKAWDLRNKKDVEGFKAILSKDVLDFFSEMGEADGKTADDMIRELMNQPQAPTAEVRNEKIRGDRAVVEYKDGEAAWKTMDFVKVGNEWKLTIPEFNKEDLKVETKP